jgi:hypothetical protein
VVYVDLTRIEVDPLLSLLMPSVLEGTPFAADLQRAQTALASAGMKDLYVIVSLAELPRQPWFLVAPCPRDLDLSALTPQLPRELPVWLGRADAQTVQRIDREYVGPMLFIGREETRNRLTHAAAQSRPELAEAWRTTDDAPIGILFVPTDDDQRVVEELLPTLPERFGGGPSTVLTRGLRWAGCAIALKPEPSLRLTVQSRDAQAAEALQRQWTKLLAGLLSPRPNAARQTADVPTPSPFERFVPQAHRDRLVLTLDVQGEGLTAFRTLVSEPIAQRVVHYYVREQLKQLAVAMHNWHDVHKAFPAQANYDAGGRPLLSWRVHLLPYLGSEAAALHRQFRLDEPWDSEHNRPLIRRMPSIYALPGSKVAHEGRTCYVRPVGESTSCPGRQPISVRDITDGTVSTVMIVEVDDEHAVVWTKPEDWTFDPAEPTKGLGGHIAGATRSVFCDGAPHVLEDTLADPQQLTAAFTRNGGEPLQFRRRILGLSQ